MIEGYVVYRILNLRNKKIYIGSTANFEIRKAEHLGQLRNNKHINRFLQMEFNDFKEENFVFEIIADGFLTRESMLVKEYELILKAKGKSYNIDTNCPVVGHSKKNKSAFGSRLLICRKEPKIKRKKKRKAKSNKIKTSFPKLDAIIDNKKRREEVRMANKQKRDYL